MSLRAVLYCSKKRKEEGRERRYKSNVVSSAAVMYEVLSAEKYYTKILERTWSDLTWKSGGYRQRDTPLRGERPAGRAQLLANFVHELDDVWLGSGNRPGAVIPLSWLKFGEFRQIRLQTKDPAKSKQNLAKI